MIAGIALLVALGLLLGRKAITASAIEWLLKRSVGVEAEVKVNSLGPQSAEADVTLREPALHFSLVRVQWWVRGIFPPKVEAQLQVEEPRQQAVGLEVIGLAADIRATVEGTSLHSALAEGSASEVRRGELRISAASFSFRFGEGLKARAVGIFPWGKTEGKFEAPRAKLEGAVEAAGKFQAKWPKGGFTGTASFHFDPGFHKGEARFDDMVLEGASIPQALKNWKLAGKFEKTGTDSRLSLEIPPLDGKDFSTASALPLSIDVTSKGIAASGTVRGNPWLTVGEILSDGLEMSGGFEWATAAYAAKAKLLAVRLPGTTQPLALSFEGRGTEEKAEFELDARDLLGEPWVEGKGTWTPKGGVQADVGREFNLGGGNFDLSNLLVLDDTFTARAGTLKVSGKLRWKTGAPRISARVRGNGLSFDYAGIPCEKLDFDFPVRRAWPFELEKPATAAFASFGTVMPLHHMQFQAVQKGKDIQVVRFDTDWGDGKVRVEPFVVSLDPLAFETSLAVDKVDAESLLKEAAAGQIKAKGFLQGKIPVAWKDGFLVVKNGLLSSGDTTGWIQYKDPTLTGLPEKIADLEQFQKLIAQGQQALAFKALDNFFFKSAQIRLERELGKGLEAFLTLSGHNPDLANGMPFQFQIGLTGQLESAVKQSVLRGLMRPEAFTDYLKKK